MSSLPGSSARETASDIFAAQWRAIAFMQWRVVRNHLPRTSAGSMLMLFLSALWYGLYGALAVGAAVIIPQLPLEQVQRWLPSSLLGVMAFWLFIPLVTLSGGWSVDLRKLQVYPVSTSSLFWLEVVLRVTTAPEMIIVLLGMVAGLWRHPAGLTFSAFLLLLYLPLNLIWALALREAAIRFVQRGRFRELIGIFFVTVGLLPQILIHTKLGQTLKPWFVALANSWFTPWQAVASLCLQKAELTAWAIILFWLTVGGWLGWQLFSRSLLRDEAIRSGGGTHRDRWRGFRRIGVLWSGWPDRSYYDPEAALLQKELRTLLRMPRFRMMFGMACLFSVLIFLPMKLQAHGGFLDSNFLPLINSYGLLMLGEVLLWNIFGFDGPGVQIYYITPVTLRTVIRMKNLLATIFICLQTCCVVVLARLLQIRTSVVDIVDCFAVTAVVTVFFIAAGNFSSVMVPRRVDPKQTFRKQAGGKMQLWFFGSSLAIALPIGLAFLARYAFGTHWALLAMLAVEFAIGMLVLRIALQSVIPRASRGRELLIERLSRDVEPLARKTFQ